MTVVYATVAEFRAKTGARESYQYAARKIASADASANTLTLEGHCLTAAERVQFVANLGGVLPAPLSAGVAYLALPVTGSTSLFQVEATLGGGAVNLTTAGTGSFSVQRSIDPLIQSCLEEASRKIDRDSLGHAVPQASPYPAEIVAWCISLAEYWVAGELGKIKDDTANDFRVMRFHDIERELVKMAKGQPLRDAAATASTNLSVRGTVSGLDSRGWDSRGNGVIP